MNLHAVAGPIVSAVNPTINGQYKVSNGYDTLSSGKTAPKYLTPIPIQIQMQALTFKDLQQLSGVNMNGESRAMYVTGNIEGVDRPSNRGGDIIVLPDNSIWLVVHVLENWASTSGWTKFAVVKQNNS